MSAVIPVVDLFAGPGGLGEGFSAFRSGGQAPFRIVLSVEKDECAHRTLLLRSVFRKFTRAPDAYYDLLRGFVTTEELYAQFPEEHQAASQEALLHELGRDRRSTERLVSSALKGLAGNWVLVGGPPCQAYSLVGRSRMKGANPDAFEDDQRHFLYREYLHILRKFGPSVFVFENVKGLLSSTINGRLVLKQMMRDFRRVGYSLHALTRPAGADPESLVPSDFVIRSEEYEIPQARHRVIILGIRDDVKRRCGELRSSLQRISVKDAIGDLPAIRSRLSTGESLGAWRRQVEATVMVARGHPLRRQLGGAIRSGLAEGVGARFMPGDPRPLSQWMKENAPWFSDPRIGGVALHESRSHMPADLGRYFFAAVFGKSYGFSPKLRDFPEALLPAHRNAIAGETDHDFADRFRVQIESRAASTVVSHIAKDGHYFIHYDPAQCRSLTVREAARLQTFPDNYFFQGTRTAQYQQVGNAVPPLLARSLARVVSEIVLGPD